jgi:O-antigen ligase
MFIAHPFLGVGVNNFFINETWLSPSLPLQPIHNIFLLVLSQTGIIGLLAFGYLLFRTIKHVAQMSFESQFRKNIRIFSLLALCVFLFIGLVDHYFFTLQQGQLLTALIFGLSWSDDKN